MAAAPARPASSPRETCFICASPRTGSTLLCDGLLRTGLAGKPVERFDDRPEVDARYKAALGVEDDVSYLHKAIEVATTVNGVAAFKIHWHQLPVFERMIAADYEAQPAEGRPDRDGHRLALFGPARCLWLRRRDKVAQAVSLYRASRSRVWHRRLASELAQPADAPSYDFSEIDRLHRLCNRYERQWESYLRQRAIAALPVWYEVLSERYDEVMRVVLDFLRLDGVAVPPPRLAKLSGTESVEWAARYRAEAGMAA